MSVVLYGRLRLNMNFCGYIIVSFILFWYGCNVFPSFLQNVDMIGGMSENFMMLQKLFWKDLSFD